MILVVLMFLALAGAHGCGVKRQLRIRKLTCRTRAGSSSRNSTRWCASNRGGTGEGTLVVVARVECDAAVRQLGVLTFSFNSSGERLTVHYVRVRKRDGSIVETPTSNFQESYRRWLRLRRCYSQVRALQIPVRSLGAGRYPRIQSSVDTDEARYSRSVLVHGRFHQRGRGEIRDSDCRCAGQ